MVVNQEIRYTKYSPAATIPMSSWQWTVDASLTIQVEAERTEQDVLAYATHVAHQAHGEGVFVDVFRISGDAISRHHLLRRASSGDSILDGGSHRRFRRNDVDIPPGLHAGKQVPTPK